MLHAFKVDLIDILNCVFTLAILFCLSHTLFTPQGGNNAQLLQDNDQSDCFKYQDLQMSTIYTCKYTC